MLFRPSSVLPAPSRRTRSPRAARGAAAALSAALLAPLVASAASFQIGELDDSDTLMRPRISLIGVAYTNRADARRVNFGRVSGMNAVGEPAPAEWTPSPPCRQPRLGATAYSRNGLRCVPSAQGRGLTAPGDTDAPSVPLQPSMLAVAAPRLLPANTDVSVKFGRLAPDPSQPAASSSETVMLASLRHGLGADQTLTASALRIGPAMLIAAAADWRLGCLGLLRGGVGMMDRGEGPLARSLIGHEFTWDRLVTRLRWERSYRVDDEDGGISPALSPAALGALPADTTQLDASASYRLGANALVQVAGNEQQALGGGPRARSFSVGSSYKAAADSRWGLAVESVRQPFMPDQQKLWVTWQVDLGNRDDPLPR